jgi:cytochrome P450
MSARDEAGEAPTDSQLRDELMTLLAAGTAATAGFL